MARNSRRSGDPVGSSVDPGDPKEVTRESGTYMTDPRAEKFCQTFTEGLESGIGYARIFSLLERNGFSSSTVGKLRQAVLEEGNKLAEAFTRFGILDETARTLVEVAEQQGTLPATFEQLADIYGDRYGRKKDIAYALAEPVILISLTILLLNLILGGNLQEMALSSNWSALAWKIGLTSLVQSGTFVLTTVTALFAWLHLPVDFSVRDFFTRLWLRVPLLSRARRRFSIALFCRYLYRSISSGMDVYSSLELAAKATNYPKLINQVNRARKHIKGGQGLAESLFEADALPDDVIEYVEIGEESGRLEYQLRMLANRYEERADDLFRRQMKVAIWLLRYGIVIVVIVAAFVSILSMDLPI